MGAGIAAVQHRVQTGSWEGAGQAALEGAIDGAVDGFLTGSAVAFVGASIGAIKYAAAATKGATPGTTHLTTIQKGQQFDRYGSLGGKYMTNPGTPTSQLALPPGNSGAKTTLQATRNFRMYTGEIAPGFGGPGGGTQYVARYSIDKMLQKGWLIIVG